MSKLKNLFQTGKPHIIGMIHVKSLPGTPNQSLSIDSLVEHASAETEVYKSCGVDSVLVENMNDLPYIQNNLMGPEITASMTRICIAVRNILPKNVSCGVQVLAGANKEAIAVAQAANLQFIRAEGFIFSHIADEGMMNSCAGELLRYRKSIGATDVLVFTDVKKKHCSHILTSDINIEDTVKAAEFFLSDGVILTGKATGNPADYKDFQKVKKISSIPILIGSGVTIDNIDDFMEADAIIIGSHFKKNGNWKNELDRDRVQKFMDMLREKRQKAKPLLSSFP